MSEWKAPQPQQRPQPSSQQQPQPSLRGREKSLTGRGGESPWDESSSYLPSQHDFGRRLIGPDTTPADVPYANPADNPAGYWAPSTTGQLSGPTYSVPYGSPGYPGYPAVSPGLLPPRMLDIPGYGLARIARVRQRFAARLIDIALTFVLSYLLYRLLFGGAVQSTKATSRCDSAGTCYRLTVTSTHVMLAIVLFSAVLLVVSLAYATLMISLKGQTFGKMALGVQVVSTTDGGNPSFRKAFVRELLPTVGLILAFIGAVVVYASVFLDDKKRCRTWYDKVANTQVITLR